MGWSQAVLAERLTSQLGHRLSSKTVGAWEIDQHKPADVVDMARALGGITGIPAAWFLGLD